MAIDDGRMVVVHGAGAAGSGPRPCGAYLGQSVWEMLRSELNEESGGLVQQVGEPLAAGWQPLRIEARMPSPRLTLSQCLAAGGAASDLIRFGLMEFAGEDRLCVSVSDLAADCWTVAIIRDQLLTLLSGGALDDSPVVEYGDYAEWQRTRERSGEFTHHVAYWSQLLRAADEAGTANQAFGLDDDDVTSRFRTAGVEDIVLTGETCELLKRVRTRERASTAIIFLGVLAQTIAGDLNPGSLIVEMSAANRTLSGLDDIIGPLQTPIILPVPAAGSAVDEISRSRGLMLAAHAHIDGHPLLVTREDGCPRWLLVLTNSLIVQLQVVPSRGTIWIGVGRSASCGTACVIGGYAGDGVRRRIGGYRISEHRTCGRAQKIRDRNRHHVDRSHRQRVGLLRLDPRKHPTRYLLACFG